MSNLVVLAATNNMFEYACHQLELNPRKACFVSTDNVQFSKRLCGLQLTNEDIIFAPGYESGRCYADVATALYRRGITMPLDKIWIDV